MKVLGLSTMGNSAATLVAGGFVIAAIEEERLTRLKNDGGFPHNAIRVCLDIAGLKLADIDEIAVYWQPWRIWGRAGAVTLDLLKDPHSARVRLRRSFDALAGGSSNQYPELRGSWMDLFRIRQIVEQAHGPFSGRIRFHDHHDCHAASAFLTSEFDQALCLSYDGGGEVHSTVVYAMENGAVARLKSLRWPNSLGHYYSTMTGFLGFRMLEGEYKMMGLAPYGKPRFKTAILRDLLQIRPNGDYRLNTKVLNYHAALRGQFSPRLTAILGEPRNPNSPFSEHHGDVAASAQAAFEEVFLHLLRWAKQKRPEIDKLCITGGCALNVTANGKAAAEGLFRRIAISPAPHDAGAAIGAALLSEARSYRQPSRSPMASAYLGRSYSESEVLAIFAANGLPAPRRLDDAELVEFVADVLVKQEIVAWFQGASEFGPRALGNRSFLADPRSDSIRDVINAKIKKRELFRPFAPSCKVEVARTFFEMDQDSPYMNIVASVRPDKRAVIPAVTHVDGTARVHTVVRCTNPLYWQLLDAFERRTGVGVLLNTSFNIQEPIVESPRDALQCFLRSAVDWLVLGNLVCGAEWRKQIDPLSPILPDAPRSAADANPR